MWPWSKFKQYEEEIDFLRHELVRLKSEVQMANQQVRRMTDRDARGRFKK